MSINESDLSTLVTKFSNLDSLEIGRYTESDVGSTFIIPLLKQLGWNIEATNPKEVREQKRDGVGRPTDYTLVIDDNDKIVVEIKRFDKSLDDHYLRNGRRLTFPQQTVDYARSLGCNWSILTNFKETRLYFTNVVNPEEGKIFSIKHDELVNSVQELDVLTKDRVRMGSLETLELKNQREPIEKELTEFLKTMRKKLHTSIDNNSNVNEKDLRHIVQKLIDRLVVLRVAEDREIIGRETIKNVCDTWQSSRIGSLYPKIQGIVNDFEQTYGTKIFKDVLKDSKGNEIKLDDDVLDEVITELYKYNFDWITADVLGKVYENFLTVQLQEVDRGSQVAIQIVSDSEARKKIGAYYTPEYLIKFIISKTIDPELEKCAKPEDVEKVKVCDPACGSGSFLIAVFDRFKKWYDDWNKKIDDENKGRVDASNDPRLINNIGKRILEHNIIGIDVDSQACEVASVNLLLKALEKNVRIPEILGKTIINGNSLIHGNESGFDELTNEEKEQINPLLWDKIKPEDGFDVVVGNPPYFKIRTSDKTRISEHYEIPQIAFVFVSKAQELVKNGGKIGLVLPKNIAYVEQASVIRKKIFEEMSLEYFIDCEKAFKGVLLEEVLLIGKRK